MGIVSFLRSIVSAYSSSRRFPAIPLHEIPEYNNHRENNADYKKKLDSHVISFPGVAVDCRLLTTGFDDIITRSSVCVLTLPRHTWTTFVYSDKNISVIVFVKMYDLITGNLFY